MPHSRGRRAAANGTLFQDHDASAGARQAEGTGGADNATTDDGDFTDS